MRWRGTGDGPRFVRLGHRTIRYRLADVEAFIATRICTSTAGA
jgi:predicted DNA-binding transcriptional regulator AlpA